jgi:hypothetical protein
VTDITSGSDLDQFRNEELAGAVGETTLAQRRKSGNTKNGITDAVTENDQRHTVHFAVHWSKDIFL